MTTSYAYGVARVIGSPVTITIAITTAAARATVPTRA